MRKTFSFIYPITQSLFDSKRRDGLRYDHSGNWMVKGVAFKTSPLSQRPDSAYEFIIEEIVYEGTDINPLIETADILNNIKAACINHIRNLFAEKDINNKIPFVHRIGRISAKVVSLFLHKKAK